ncbi:MAG: hypothetical protein AAGN66_02500 [Acidobacteriota bacterium]
MSSKTLQLCRSLVLCAAALGFSAPVAFAQFGPQPSPAASVVSTRAQAEDLVVTVDWGPQVPATPAELVVGDAEGLTLEVIPVVPVAAGRSDHGVSAFLRRVPAEGFEFSVRLRGVGGDPLSEPMPFRVFFDCPAAAAPCRWTTEDALTSGAPIVHRAMATALDGALTEEGGAGDLLTHLLAARPELTGQVWSLAAQLSRFEDDQGVDPTCFCLWLASFHRDPSSPTGTVDPFGDPGFARQAGPGASLATGAQTRGGSWWLEDHGEGRLSLGLPCLQIRGWSTTQVTMETGMTARSLRMPSLGSCPGHLCRGDVSFTADVEGRLTLRGKTTPGAQIEAQAAAEGHLTALDEADNLWGPATWEETGACGQDCQLSADPQTFQGDLALDLYDVTRGTGIVADRTSVSLHAQGEGPWCLACASASVGLRGTAEADCAVDRRVVAEMVPQGGSRSPLGPPCGELKISPWLP